MSSQLLTASRTLPLLGVTVAGLILTACDGGLDVRLTDAPIDSATAVNVRLTGAELVRSDGNTQAVDFEDRTVNLLDLSGGASISLFNDDGINEGSFTGVRLLIDSSNTTDSASTIVFDDGGEFPLAQIAGSDALASGSFSVSEDEQTSLVIDFDARASIRSPVAGDANSIYRISPQLRLVDPDNAGTLRGTVAEALLTDEACDNDDDNQLGNAVYVFEGADVTPDDLDGIAPEALSSAPVALNASSGDFEYVAAFLPAGDYTVALTCQGRLDEPGQDDAVAFSQSSNVTISAGQTSSTNFDDDTP